MSDAEPDDRYIMAPTRNNPSRGNGSDGSGDSSGYAVTIQIRGEAKNHVESFLNDLHKQVDEGRTRYGVSLDIERIELQEEDSGFSKANE